MEAIETLNAIADLDFDNSENQLSLSLEGETASQPKLVSRVNWLSEGAKRNGRVKEIFGVILNYLRNFYRNEQGFLTDPQTLEGIKGIMALVSDAAKKIDRYASCVKGGHCPSVTQLKEYKQLNEFYRTRIARQVDESLLGKWLLALSKRNLERQNELFNPLGSSARVKPLEEAPKHLFVNLEAVKNDTEYELFFIRKEDGSHFFSPRLLRNIKLICDFSGGEQARDPLLDIKLWIDFQMHSAAHAILHAAQDRIERFYHEAFKYKHREFAGLLHKSIMALFLAGNARNLMRQLPSAGEELSKTCYAYFADFQHFLHQALRSDEYHKMIAYPAEKTGEVGALLLDLAHSLCRAVYFNLKRFHDFEIPLEGIFKASEVYLSAEQLQNGSLGGFSSRMIASQYAAMSKLFKFHSRGPLAKLLEVLLDGDVKAFEPFAQLNVPSQLYALAMGGHKIINLHLPSPTYQEYIHRVSVLDEFRGALRGCNAEFPVHRHLLVNLQDRTSWREHSRSMALEEMRAHDEAGKSLTVVTLAKDTEFYHQLASYQHENHADVFIKQFNEHLGGENSGYYFPSTIKSAILSGFAAGVMGAIHRIFFSGKNMLLREHRLAFIEIFDLFLTLKVLDLVKPNSFSLTCKDGVDTSAGANGLLFLFMKLVSKGGIDQEAFEDFNRIFYGPAILVRERLVLKERFDRMLGALKVLDSVHHELGHEVFAKVVHEAFGHYYKNGVFDGTLVRADSL